MGAGWRQTGLKLPKVSPQITKLMKNAGFVMSILARLRHASVFSGAGHLLTSPQPLSLLLSSISFCESSFKAQMWAAEEDIIKVSSLQQFHYWEK